MTLKKINTYAKYSQIVSKPKPTVRHIQHWNPVTSELLELKATVSKRITVKNQPFLLIKLSNITHYEAGSMPADIANYLKHFRSFVLGMLKGAIGFIKCKSYEAARKYSNLGGQVVMVKNEGGAAVWGVIK